jgi:Arc/MetJ family transcription regulator
MRTNIVLDEKMVKKAMRLSKAKTKREVVDLALREYVASRERWAALDELFGSNGIDPAYDYKAARIGRSLNVSR